ncbi:hypothetical protein [Streptomyces altiplanensis]
MKLTELLGVHLDEIPIWPVVPLKRHPASDEIEDMSLDWAVSRDLVERDSPQAHSRLGGTLADCMPYGDAKAALAFAWCG